ncbi:MAG: RdgB/HAM1 family non-canonical purine NTP pyrophosphatase [Parcubacteria group bacterium]|nr:RdgB/HAM1 family non-canonical purine NTP pyrophosphatase [Parcubacteria group bacterium]
MKIILATHNQGKVEEVKDVFTGLNGMDIISMEEAGIKGEAEENGETIEENVLKKANYVAQKTSEWVIADDTGVYINALGGKPGAYPKRFVEKFDSQIDKMNFILEQMKNVSDNKRNVYFKTAVALISPQKEKQFFEGKINGIIVKQVMGVPDDFLPYDTLFQPEGFDKTFSQMDKNEKNKISHRAKAFREAKEFLKNI